jgi:methylated-DNA-[protein]-cysteine S-methyltransferase
MECTKEMKTYANPMFYEVIPSQFGDVGVVWYQEADIPRVAGILLPRRGRKMAGIIQADDPHAVRKSHPDLSPLVLELEKYMNTGMDSFSREFLDMERCNEFQKRVLGKLSEVPRGKVISYGQLADKIYAPRAARAVGTAVARNPFPVVLPCHRVVKADGHLGNFGGGTDLKKALLRLEGVEVDANGHIGPGFFW